MKQLATVHDCVPASTAKDLNMDYREPPWGFEFEAPKF